MGSIPHEKTFDSTLAFLAEGYPFISRRCQRFRSDIFATRLMLHKVFCMLGEEAARVFYQAGRLTRRGAMPTTALWLLQDTGSVALLDEEAHHRRKQMFMALMTPAHLQQFVDIMTEEWHIALRKWAAMDTVVLLDAVQEILCRAVCKWSGVPLTDAEAPQRTAEFAAMIDGAGSIGLRNWRGQLLRGRTERWISAMIAQVRDSKLDVPEGSAFHAIAWHRSGDGNLLSRQVATVEVLNVLRPTVAIALYVVFAALALHEYPQGRQRLTAGDEAYLPCFVQEVRRFYPFFPCIGGRVEEEFTWRGQHFPRHTWFLLDLYGTNHDPRLWEEPDTFQPERFRHWQENAYSFLPQGGGEHAIHHRCAGEWMTIECMKRAVSLLTTAMQYDVPGQNLQINLSRIPALPQSRFVMRNVHPCL